MPNGCDTASAVAAKANPGAVSRPHGPNAAWARGKTPFFRAGKPAKLRESPGHLPASEKAATWPLSRSEGKRPFWRRMAYAAIGQNLRRARARVSGRPTDCLAQKRDLARALLSAQAK
jgi:hypothetical protein